MFIECFTVLIVFLIRLTSDQSANWQPITQKYNTPTSICQLQQKYFAVKQIQKSDIISMMLHLLKLKQLQSIK